MFLTFRVLEYSSGVHHALEGTFAEPSGGVSLQMLMDMDMKWALLLLLCMITSDPTLSVRAYLGVPNRTTIQTHSMQWPTQLQVVEVKI